MKAEFWRTATWVLFVVFLFSADVVAEIVAARVAPPADAHQETAEDVPLPPPGTRAVTPGAMVMRGRHVSVQVNVDAGGGNIVGDAANEPSIALDALNPNRIAIGWRQFDNVASNFRQAGRAFTDDGGHSWTFTGVHEPGVFRSDPVLDYDADGVIYYNSLTSDFTCQYFLSDDGGQTWTGAIEAFGGDKLWSAIDRTTGPGRGNIYCAWSTAAGCCGARIFTRSTDGGFSWMVPTVLPLTPIWGTLAVASDGALYIAGRAVNGQATVLRSDNAQFAAATPTFGLARSVSLGGDTATGGVNPAGLLGQVWIACEPPGGPHPDNVYLLASVDPPGGDPLDVMFTRSTDRGVTWSVPRRINDDPPGNGAWQWFGGMDVAPNGRIDVVWNDTRVQASNTLSELYYASSVDGGATFSANEPLSPPFNHSLGYPNQAKLGDYCQVRSENGYANVAYAATFNGEQDVYFLRVAIDCNANGVVDSEDVAGGTSTDCDANGVPDECDCDCDGNGAVDACEIAAGAADCDGNGRLDVCDIAAGGATDCDGGGIPDDCELAAGSAADCNASGTPDGCDIAAGLAADCNANGVPDTCDAVLLAQHIVPPADARACVGAAAEFTVAAPGATDYQWRFDGMDIPNATGALLRVDPVTPADEGVYTCVVTADCVSAESAPAALRVASAALTLSLVSPSPVTACTSAPWQVIVMRTAVNDADGVMYQWEHDGVDLIDDARIRGAQSAVLEIAAPQPGDGGSYGCRAWNECAGEAAAVSTTGLVVIADPVFSAPPDNVCAELGTSAVFQGRAGAEQTLLYRWHEGDVALVDGGRLTGTHSDTLTLSGVTAGDQGRQFRLLAIAPDPPCVRFSAPAILVVQAPGGCAVCLRPGDLDADGDYDLMDLQRFQACLGTAVPDRPACACADLDGVDATVDLEDWRWMSPLIGGPR